MNAKDKVEKNKVRMIVKSYKQNVGIYYDEVFASLIEMKTIRLIFLYQHKIVGTFFKCMSNQYF